MSEKDAASSVGSLCQLLQVLVKGVLSSGAPDLAFWKPEPKEGYSVKLCNSILEKIRVVNDVDATLQKAFCSVCLTKSPFKVITFV